MRSAEATTAPASLVPFLLARADDALILGHRLSEWCGRGPMLEEDMALANIGLDLIGQARELFTYAGACEGRGRGEDDFAYLRDVREYRNILMVEQPNGDFARTMVRQFLYSAFADPYWQAMMACPDPTLSAIAAKSEKESAYHLRHSAEWVVRLGDGTEESHARTEAALGELWAYTGELFEPDEAEASLVAADVVVDPRSLVEGWRDIVSSTLERATLAVPRDGWKQRGGRSGRHSEHLGHLLSELQYLQRAFPGASW